MNEKQAREILEKHNKSKCDCLDGDAYNNEPSCYIAMGYLEAIDKANPLAGLLSELLKDSRHLSDLNIYWSYSDTLHFELKKELIRWQEEK